LRLIGLAVVLALSVVLAPLTDEAQPVGKGYRIGFLSAGPPPGEFVEAFQQGLGARGYIDGRNVVIEYRSTDGSFDELPRLAAELVRFNVDVILVSGAPAAFCGPECDDDGAYRLCERLRPGRDRTRDERGASRRQRHGTEPKLG